MTHDPAAHLLAEVDRDGRRPTCEETEDLAVDLWNRSVPPGTPVVLTDDDGVEHRTKTRSVAWLLGSSSRGPGHTAVVLVEGRTGGYLLSRLRPVTEVAL